MLKISKLLDYGLLVIVTIAKNDSSPYSAVNISEVTGLNIPTVRKLLNMFNQAGVISSKRGIDGGYILASSPKDIKVLDIVKAIEKDVNLTECCDNFKNSCLLKGCSIKSYWQIMNSKFLDMLSSTSIEDIVKLENIEAKQL